MPRKPLVLISGKDVLDGVAGPESSVRAHALAAARAGFEPHVFCVGRRTGIATTEFGQVHHGALPPPVEPPVAVHGPLRARAVAAFLAPLPGPHVNHAFAVWAAAGVAA